MIAFLVIIGIKMALLAYFSYRHYKQSRDEERCTTSHPVTVIIPCYNEDKTIENCLRSLLVQTHKKYEIILVDDGSTDTTGEICDSMAALFLPKIKVLRKDNGGKASALRLGLNHARGDIVVTLDADSILMPDALERLVESFNDPAVGAVGGNVKVANRKNILGRHQTIEYISGLTIQRRAFAFLGCMQVMSGAIAAFRKDVLKEIGGHSSDTIVEDMDVTISVLKAGYKVKYDGSAIAYTEAPENLWDFLRQRCRWTFGGFQVINKHKTMLFNRKYGNIGMIGLTYFLIFPWIDVAISLLFFYIVAKTIWIGAYTEFVIFYAGMAAIQCLMLLYALKLDMEDKRLVWLCLSESFWYNHLISFATLSAGIRYACQCSISWNKMERLGKNTIEGE